MTGQNNKRADRKVESKNNPEIPDMGGETPEVPDLPLGRGLKSILSLLR